MSVKDNKIPSGKIVRRGLVGACLIGFIVGLYLLILATSPLVMNLDLPIIVSPKVAIPAVNILAGTPDTLLIPKLGVDLPFTTGDASVLNDSVWWRHPERGNPAEGGNFILSAHRFQLGWTPQQTRKKSPFYHLNKLESGDQVYIIFREKLYKYLVSSRFSVKPSQISIEDHSDSPILTIYSCTFGGTHDGREVIRALPAN